MERVLHFQCSAGFWGAERQISELVEPMRSHGFEIEALVLYRHQPTLPVTHPLVAAVRQQGGGASQRNDRWRDLPNNLLAVVQKLQAGDYALVHTHGYKSNLIGGLSAKLVDVPTVASIRGYTDRTLPLRFYKHVDLLALRWFDRILPVSDHVRDRLLKARLPGRRIITVHDGINPGSFQKSASSDAVRLRQQVGLDSTSKVVSTVGRLSQEKGHRYFVESVPQILERFPEAHFLIVGDGPERDSLESLVAGLGIQRAVSFLGYRRDVAAIMGLSDVVVLASLREAFGDVLIEAMSLAKPVVATAVGGVPEIVRHEETGLLVPAGDPDVIARAITRLLHDPAWARQLGKRGREVMVENFHIDMLARRLALVYQELLDHYAR